jgi:hypothetical protein
VAESQGLALRVPLEVEGIRLIADMVAAGDFVPILPETAVPPEPSRPRVRDRQHAAALTRIVSARDAVVARGSRCA